MKSPITYFGGKNGFANKILNFFPQNYEELKYIEPFCGSAALLFYKNFSPVEIINDIDDNVYSLFKTLIDEEKFNKFKEWCDLTPFSEKLLKEYKEDLKKELSIEERAYKYFYCNRVAFNSTGGISVGGSIRRKMSKSISDYLSAIDKLYDVHNRLSKVIVLKRDALGLIEKWDKKDVFMYCDSPYAWETRSGSRYSRDLNNESQDKYLDVLSNVKNAKILVSGYNCERYKKLEDNGYQRYDMEIKTQDTNQKGKSKIESLWKNY